MVIINVSTPLIFITLTAIKKTGKLVSVRQTNRLTKRLNIVL